MRFAVSVMLATAVVLSTAASAAERRNPVQALLFKGRTVSFTTLDPTTLEQRGRLVPLGRAQGSVSSDRLGNRLAIASAGAGIVIVDTRRMRVTWRVPRGRLVRAVSWVAPDRLLVAEHGGVLLLDPARKRIVGRSRYDGLVVASARWSGGLVLLAHRNEGEIGPARLIVVGPGARTRSVDLDRILAGWASGPSGQVPFNRAQPGLAVDPGGGRAFVAGAAQIATIDLATLGVEYRGSERTLQKVTTGPRRSAAWLGEGALAVAGSDESVTGTTLASTPFGLRLVTSAGVRIVDERATDVRAAGGLALAYGVRYSEGRPVGSGLAAYDRQGALRWRLFGDAPVTDVKLTNGLAYVWALGRWNVVEVATGAIVGGSPGRSGMLFLQHSLRRTPLHH